MGSINLNAHPAIRLSRRCRYGGGSSTIWVCVTSATARPASFVILVCQTIVRRPPSGIFIGLVFHHSPVRFALLQYLKRERVYPAA
jgi:hypothetical protein